MGHRLVEHTADVRVEAWAPTREECLAEAVRGAVASFVDVPEHGVGALVTGERELHLDGEGDEDLLVTLLDEVVFLLDTTGDVPVDVALSPSSGPGVDARLTMAGVSTMGQVGAVPKAVSLHEVRLSRGAEGWSCSVTLDV